jgi:hypothetical protein
MAVNNFRYFEHKKTSTELLVFLCFQFSNVGVNLGGSRHLRAAEIQLLAVYNQELDPRKRG